MFGVFMEVMRRQYRREHRYFGLQLYLHQTADNGLGDEFMAINTAVHHQTAGDDGAVLAAFGQQLCMQRNFKRARHFEQVDLRGGNVVGGEGGEETFACAIDNILVPTRLDKRDLAVEVFYCRFRAHEIFLFNAMQNCCA
jgi:hypothetical protein